MAFRFLVLASMVLAAMTLAAQVSTPFDNSVPGADSPTKISGTVFDMNNHPVSGARVEVDDLLTGRILGSTYTYSNGNYEFDHIPSGQYEVVASFGLSESRNRIQTTMSEGDVNFRLDTNTPMTTGPAGENSSVALSQMQVPAKARKLFEKAMSAFRKSHQADAFSLVQKALHVDPNYAQALALRGVLNLQRGDTLKAQPDLEKAVQLDYSDSMSFVALASLYNDQAQYDHALQVLHHGIRLHPTSWQAWTETARAQIGKREYAEALDSLHKADNSLPGDVYYPHLLKAQALMGLKNAEGAIAEARAYLAKEPTGRNAETARKMLAYLGVSGLPQARK